MRHRERRALRYVIQIQRRIKSENAVTGQVTSTYESEFANVRADIEQAKLEEKDNSRQSVSQAKSSFIIRYRPGVTTSHRILLGSTAHGIVGTHAFVDEYGTKWIRLYVEGETCSV